MPRFGGWERGDIGQEIYAVGMEFERHIALVWRRIGIGLDSEQCVTYDGPNEELRLIDTREVEAKLRPLLKLDQDTMRQVYLALHRYYERKGERPPAVERIEGELEAMKAHLADMRNIACDALKDCTKLTDHVLKGSL